MLPYLCRAIKQKNLKAKDMNLQDVKNLINEFGRNDICDDSVIEITNDNTVIKNVDNFNPNHISLMDVVFDFSRNFNDNVINSFLTELNVLIELSKTNDIIKLHNAK